MDYLRIVDWSRRQHFKERRPPWIKAYADRLDLKSKDGAAFALLTRDAMALMFMLELLASRQDPPGLIPYNAGWVEHELRMMRLSSKQIAKLISELIAAQLLEAISVNEIQTDIRFPLARTFARESVPLEVSESLGEATPREGRGEGIDAELPDRLRISPALLLAVEHYRLAAARGSWPGIRDASLRRLEAKFHDVDKAIRDEEPEFDWLICFSRGVEQPFICTRISSFGFEWFLRKEFGGTKFNALKVWDGHWRDRPNAAAPPARCGSCANCSIGMPCTVAARGGEPRSLCVVRIGG